jgi:UDP-N-acetylglucosamine diphosphorylase / glucose-1-phosphate thymidylyltransferase / UDP-N-acetylgalactosamine diphosphorylase / glucosamine-1-phosphate N-acetyltransferase / galactosamine-1-phosphate N-acetyltransferase
MKAIILAAGEGVRMRPLTLTLPKPLIAVAGKPIIEHLVSRFPKEIDEIIIVVGYLGNRIIEYCGKNFLGRPVTYVWQKKKLGTYQALELCRPHLKKSEPFAVFYSDDLVDKKAINRLMKHELALMCSTAEDPRHFGVVTPDGQMNVKSIVEKPQNPTSNLVSVVGFKLNEKIFDYKPEPHASGEFYLPAAVSKMAQEHKFKIIVTDLWISFSTFEDVAKKEHLVE